MPSVFETAPATSAIPITFATKSTWDSISAELPAPAQQFASSNGFAAKPGACLTLPAADGKIAQALFGLEEAASKSRDLFRPGALPGLLPPGGIDAAEITRMADAAWLARDLINTPSNDMGPEELAQAAEQLAARFGASFNC